MSDTELLPKSSTGTVRRLEVFTGTGRRRAWSAEQKEMIVAESCSCGESISVIARRHGLTPQQLFAWRRSARLRAKDGACRPAFVPVVVDDGAACSDGAPLIEIVIGAATVRVASGINAASLAAVLRAVKAVT
jgi:transposase